MPGWIPAALTNAGAELEESIRSMFCWYSCAKVCIAHLADTKAAGWANTFSFHSMHYDAWFKRGWNLQELLAPTSVKFFDMDWHPITSNADDKIADTEDVPLADHLAHHEH